MVSLQYLMVKGWRGKDRIHRNRVDPRGRGDTCARDGDEDIARCYNRAPTKERGGATQAVASQQYANANSEGGKEPRHESGHPFWGLPILTMKKATLRQVHGVSF